MDPTNNPPQNQESDREHARRLRREQEQRELDERKQLGREGRLFCIEVLFRKGNNETSRMQMPNCTGAEVLQFREGVFKAGLKLPIDPGRWKIISPWDILDIDITRQNTFFEV